MVELGQIEKPEAEQFSGKRKLYCIANIYAIEDAPEDFKSLIDTYWGEVLEQIGKIESAGKITKIFCELMTENDDNALEMLSRVNEKLPEIIKRKMDDGGALVPIETEEILGPYTDWANCLRVVFTQEVFSMVLERYNEFSQKRLDHILKVIDTSLAASEAGLLILKDEDRSKLQFPQDIEVFLITPPTYDDIMRWIRDKMMRRSKEKVREDDTG
jgi:hypothetical protein